LPPEPRYLSTKSNKIPTTIRNVPAPMFRAAGCHEIGDAGIADPIAI
jgi:hypothetical protein